MATGSKSRPTNSASTGNYIPDRVIPFGPSTPNRRKTGSTPAKAPGKVTGPSAEKNTKQKERAIAIAGMANQLKNQERSSKKK